MILPSGHRVEVNFIRGVLFGSAPTEVAESIVRFGSIREVAALHPFGAGSYEGF